MQLSPEIGMSAELLAQRRDLLAKAQKSIYTFGGKSQEELMAMYAQAGIRTTLSTRHMLGSIQLGPLRELELATVTVQDLLQKDATTRQIFGRIQDLRLGFCSQDVGPYLRLAYQDQPKCDVLVVVSEPINDIDGVVPLLFNLVRDGENKGGTLLLYEHSAHPIEWWDASRKLIICTSAN